MGPKSLRGWRRRIVRLGTTVPAAVMLAHRGIDGIGDRGLIVTACDRLVRVDKRFLTFGVVRRRAPREVLRELVGAGELRECRAEPLGVRPVHRGGAGTTGA